MPGGTVAPVTGNPFKTGLFPRMYLWGLHPRHIAVLPVGLCLRPPRRAEQAFPISGHFYGGDPSAGPFLLCLANANRNVLGITKLQSTGLQVAYFGIGYFCFSPVAGFVLRRWGYKKCILMGLTFYSVGAILFWPVAKASTTSTNKQGVFGGFVVCTAIIACGLSSLEVAANSYVSVMPPLEVASLRLQFSQSFNGVASFVGPLIASKYFFSSANSTDLSSVQWVYLAVACMGAIIAVAFVCTKLPEVSEAALEAAVELEEMEDTAPKRALWRETRATTGFLAQFLYVGAQVTIGSFFLNYTNENAGIQDTRGSQLLSYALLLFTVGRFVGVALLSVLTAPVLLFAYACICTIIAILIGTLHGIGGVACIMLIMFFESIMYPTIFVLGTSGLGRNTRAGSALIVMGVSGGAVFPPIQGAIADHFGTRVSFYLVVPCFVYIACWALFIWNKDGRQSTVFSNKAAEAARRPSLHVENGVLRVHSRVSVSHPHPTAQSPYDEKATAHYDEKSTDYGLESVASRK